MEITGLLSRYLSELLSKNTTGLIIGYLMDPPELPYLKELENRTRFILKDNDYCYSNHYIRKGLSNIERIDYKPCIIFMRPDFGNWYVQIWCD